MCVHIPYLYGLFSFVLFLDNPQYIPVVEECLYSACRVCKEPFFFSPCVVYHLPLCFVPVRRVPPRFSIPPTNHEIMPGGSVNITCVAVGSPMPYVKWMLGAEDLTPEDDMPIGRNVLELNDVRQSANYTCVAMSTLGVIEAIAQITVKGMLSDACFGGQPPNASVKSVI